MFSILCNKGNANPSNTEIPSLIVRIGYHQENKQQMLEKMWGGGKNTSTTTVEISTEAQQ
jgi:hypothetical protein